MTVPTKQFTRDKFESGHAFDGSSIGRMEGHPCLGHVADAGRRRRLHRPCMDETTLNITCDVIEPSDGKGYERDPRSLAKRAEAYLKSTRPWRHLVFRSEPEFFVFDAVEWSVDMSGSYCNVFSSEAAWVARRENSKAQHGPPADRQGRLFPVPAGRFAAGHPVRDVPRYGADWRRGRVHHHEVAKRRTMRNRHQVRNTGEARRLAADPEYAVHNTAHAYGKTATFHAEAYRRRQRSACMSTNPMKAQEPVCGDGYSGPVGPRALLHRRRDQAREGAERDHQPRGRTPTSGWCPASKRRSTCLLGTHRSAAIRIPMCRTPRPPDRVLFPIRREPLPPFAAMLMAGSTACSTRFIRRSD